MKLLSILREKLFGSGTQKSRFDMPEEELLRMMSCEEIPSSQKKANTIEFKAYDNEGNLHHLTYKTSNTLAPAILDIHHTHAVRYCEERNYLFESMSAYLVDGRAGAEIGQEINFGPMPTWMYESLEQEKAAEERYEREKSKRERIYELAKKKKSAQQKIK